MRSLFFIMIMLIFVGTAFGQVAYFEIDVTSKGGTISTDNVRVQILDEVVQTQGSFTAAVYDTEGLLIDGANFVLPDTVIYDDFDDQGKPKDGWTEELDEVSFTITTPYHPMAEQILFFDIDGVERGRIEVTQFQKGPPEEIHIKKEEKRPAMISKEMVEKIKTRLPLILLILALLIWFFLHERKVLKKR